MPDELEKQIPFYTPSPERPLQGMTVLVVEDSRFASEAIRLLCLRSGARIRRADSLASARRHLRVYRPTVLIVDMGLPDGSGAGLIRDMADAPPRVPVILGISGDDGMGQQAMAAGADGFLAKPIENLAAFQHAVLESLPQGDHPVGPRLVLNDAIAPDPVALREDLSVVADVLGSAPDERELDYIAQFLGGVARSARDETLEVAAASLVRSRTVGPDGGGEIARVANLVQDRLQASATF